MRLFSQQKPRTKPLDLHSLSYLVKKKLAKSPFPLVTWLATRTLLTTLLHVEQEQNNNNVASLNYNTCTYRPINILYWSVDQDRSNWPNHSRRCRPQSPSCPSAVSRPSPLLANTFQHKYQAVLQVHSMLDREREQLATVALLWLDYHLGLNAMYCIISISKHYKRNSSARMSAEIPDKTELIIAR